MVDVIVPLYQSEVSPMKERGRMVGSHACLLVCGYVSLTHPLNTGKPLLTTTRLERAGLALDVISRQIPRCNGVYALLQIVAPLLLALESPWIPESPRWLVYNGFQNEALLVLRKLHSRPDGSSNSVAEEELAQIVQQVTLDRANEMSFFALWRNPSTRKRLVLGFFIIFTTQSSGVLVSFIQINNCRWWAILT
jgi:hypothetical protein